MLTFLLSGLWHGAAWHFIVWGGIHGLYRVIEEWTKPFCNKFVYVGNHNKACKNIKRCIIFFSTCFAWTFFRADSTVDALRIFKSILVNRSMRVTKNIGLDGIELFILLSAVLVMFYFDLIKYKKNQTIDLYIEKKGIVIKWAILYGLLIYVLVFGIYGPLFDSSQFIYFQF